MKGVLICGGKGTRLYPLTKTVNKQLMPVYNKPLVHYPLATLIKAGIKEIMIVSGAEHADQFLQHFGNNDEFADIRFEFAVQKEPGGIAQALGLARYFVGDDKCVAILGDNIYEDDFSKDVEAFKNQDQGAKIFIKEVPDPRRFGCPEISHDGTICRIIEKPEIPPSRYCVTGLYMYDNKVWDVIEHLKPSGRGELEITDVNNHYVYSGTMTYGEVKGAWIDAGTFDSLLKANIWAAQKNSVNVADILTQLEDGL
ncbi:NTP transferase domain-containing protein [Candidatus Falkowbacteria bacterium]|nr:NTP transferase domain-containing protein [Candidatus Falkowbacteria bacterium]